MTTVPDDRRHAIYAAVDGLPDQLLATSHYIHANPEVRITEQLACARLGDELAEAGFAVERGVGTLPTAFRAEYDACRRSGDRPCLRAQRDRQ
jgi:metal-dependent amidase/aminoacylase/carboxypeptidase family protein